MHTLPLLILIALLAGCTTREKVNVNLDLPKVRYSE